VARIPEGFYGYLPETLFAKFMPIKMSTEIASRFPRCT
jgi:hypothetical protein